MGSVKIAVKMKGRVALNLDMMQVSERMHKRDNTVGWSHE